MKSSSLLTVLALGLGLFACSENQPQPDASLPALHTTVVGALTEEMVQKRFDANKSSFYRIYRGALRENRDLEGSMYFDFQITPAGDMTAASVIRNETHDAEFADQVFAKLQQVHFLQAEGPTFVKNYTITFKRPS